MIRAILIATLFLSGCNKLPDPKGPRICFSAYPMTFDPRLSADIASATVVGLLYEGLTRCLPDGSVEKGLAERIEVSEDLRIYTFHIRKAIWSDGSPIKASDFERSWKEQLDPASPCISRYLFYPILNAELASRGQKSLSEVGIRSLDNKRLEVTLEHPTPYFISLTAFPSFFPVKDGESIDVPEEKKIGNGPFRVAKIIAQSEIILEKNPYFWNRHKILSKELRIAIIPDENTALRLFERGELDWIGGVLSPLAQDAISELNRQQRLEHIPIAASSFCVFNANSQPFANLHMRRAFMLSIHRDDIAGKIVNAGQVGANECIPPALWGARERNLLPSFDPDQARAELQIALQELGIAMSDLPHIALQYRANHVERQIAEALRLQWLEILGIDVELIKYDSKRHRELLHKRNYQISLANWIPQYSDPINILERFNHKENPKNYPGWEDTHFTDLLNRAKREIDPNMRLDLLDQAEKMLCEQSLVAPLYHWTGPVLRSSRLHNVQTTPNGGVLFDRSFTEFNNSPSSSP